MTPAQAEASCFPVWGTGRHLQRCLCVANAPVQQQRGQEGRQPDVLSHTR